MKNYILIALCGVYAFLMVGIAQGYYGHKEERQKIEYSNDNVIVKSDLVLNDQQLNTVAIVPGESPNHQILNSYISESSLTSILVLKDQGNLIARSNDSPKDNLIRWL